jgi:uncharacterized membrane protein YphA (DoxX/SURF4 family)
MTNLHKTGQHMFLMGIAELAIYSFVKGDIAMTRPRPLPEFLQGINPAMAYVSGALFLISVFLFYLNRYRSAALFTIVNLVFWLVTTRHIVNLWRDHINAFKSLWFISGALLILVCLDDYRKYQKQVLWFNIIILAVFFVDCGIAHFQYAEFVQTLIPTFFPSPLFFTYFAGVCLVAGGIGLLIPQTKKLAALLSGIQIAGWFILLHIPRALSLGGDEWIGVGESLAVSGICFMIFTELRSSSLKSETWNLKPETNLKPGI